MQRNYRLTILPRLRTESGKLTQKDLSPGDVIKWGTNYCIRTSQTDLSMPGSFISLMDGELLWFSGDDWSNFVPVTCSLREE